MPIPEYNEIKVPALELLADGKVSQKVILIDSDYFEIE